MMKNQTISETTGESDWHKTQIGAEGAAGTHRGHDDAMAMSIDGGVDKSRYPTGKARREVSGFVAEYAFDTIDYAYLRVRWPIPLWGHLTTLPQKCLPLRMVPRDILTLVPWIGGLLELSCTNASSGTPPFMQVWHRGVSVNVLCRFSVLSSSVCLDRGSRHHVSKDLALEAVS